MKTKMQSGLQPVRAQQMIKDSINTLKGKTRYLTQHKRGTVKAKLFNASSQRLPAIRYSAHLST